MTLARRDGGGVGSIGVISMPFHTWKCPTTAAPATSRTCSRPSGSVDFHPAGARLTIPGGSTCSRSLPVATAVGLAFLSPSLPRCRSRCWSRSRSGRPTTGSGRYAGVEVVSGNRGAVVGGEHHAVGSGFGMLIGWLNPRMAETPTTQQILDQEMIARISRRDQSAFSAIYDRLSGPLYFLAMKMLGDPAEAQDTLQDVFLQIWSRAGKLRSGTEQRLQLDRAADSKPGHRSLCYWAVFGSLSASG